MYITFSIILIVIGIVMILKPKIVFNFLEGWKNSTSSEPSNLYTFSTRLGGILSLGGGIVVLVVFLFL